MLRALLERSVRLVPWRLRGLIKRLPVVAWAQQRLLAAALDGKEFVHTVDAGPAEGLVYPVVLPDDKGVWTGTYELAFVEALAGAVEAGSVCFDVGGFRGYCAGVMARAGAAKTHVFEPFPANCARIEKLIDLNPELPLSLHPVAVGREDGSATFRTMPESSMGKLEASPFQGEEAGLTELEVEVVSLDSWCERAGVESVGLIKLDIEGAEMMALDGARGLIERARPHFFIEAHSRELAAEVTDFLTRRSYSVRTLETGRAPDGSTEPEVCHIEARPA